MQVGPTTRAVRRLPRRRIARRCLLTSTATALALLATSVHPLVAAPAASAQATCGTTLPVNAALRASPGQLSASATTPVTVIATNYLTGKYVCGSQRFGGVYVFFGWVAPGGQWGPSHRSSTSSNGQFGVTFSYPGEGGGGDTRDDGSGVVRLVSFTAGGTSGSETPFHMDTNGNWSTTVNVRGALYSWTDVNTGATNTVDCRTVQCGIFTIGAHGLASGTNELFAPLSFRNDGPPPTVAPGGVSASTSPTTPPRSSAGAGYGTTPGRPSAGSPSGGSAGASDSQGSGTDVIAPGTVAPSDAPGATPSDPGDEVAAASEEQSAERLIVAGEVVDVRDFDSPGSGGVATLLVLLAVAIGSAITTGWLVRRRGHRTTGGG